MAATSTVTEKSSRVREKETDREGRAFSLCCCVIGDLLVRTNHYTVLNLK
jgi:hypothetical protein